MSHGSMARTFVVGVDTHTHEHTCGEGMVVEGGQVVRGWLDGAGGSWYGSAVCKYVDCTLDDRFALVDCV